MSQGLGEIMAGNMLGSGGKGGVTTRIVRDDIGRITGITQQLQGMPAPSVERWTCDHCGTAKEWRSVDPGPAKCASCGAPRKP